MEALCEKCPKWDQCTTPCKAVNDILWKNNRVMERRSGNKIVCYPRNGEIHFSELDIAGIEDMDDFSMHDVIPWSSEDRRLMKTKVFIERFFKKTPYRELAERYKVKENTIVTMYSDAVKSIEKIVDQLDSRREGMKATKADRFTDDQKFFLLVSVFGFSGEEVAGMFNLNRDTVNVKVKRMSDRYGAAFSGEKKQESPIKDPPLPAKLTRAEVVAMVDAYTKQGLSRRQAFDRIADWWGGVIGRVVSSQMICSKYYRATAAAKPKPFRSVYDGLSKEQAMERIAY